MSWLLVVQLLVMGFSLISLLIYQARRSGNVDAANTLRRKPVLRTLSEEETAALEPLRQAEKLMFQPDVRRLTGSYHRHGVTMSAGSTMHDTIDDVTVLLPYDAPLFLKPENEAEVVISGNLAVVVRLNEFDIVSGRSRALASLGSDAAAPTQAPGTASISGENTPFETTAPTPVKPSVEWLWQRNETSFETRLRQQPGTNSRAVVLWCIATVLLWFGTIPFGGPLHIALIVVGVALTVLAIVLLVRRPRAKPEPSRKIDRARGPLIQLLMPSANNATVHNSHVFLGDDLKLQLPKHWEKSGRIVYGQPMELEVDRLNGKVWGLGSGWSLEDEARRFPEGRWKKHMLLTSVASVGMLMALMVDGGVVSGLRTSATALLDGTTRRDTSAASLLEKPPRLGDTLRLSGEGTCELATPSAVWSGGIEANCFQVRWGGKPLNIPEPRLDPDTAALYSGAYLKTRPSAPHAMTNAVLDQDPSRSPVPVLEVRGLETLVGLIERRCGTESPECIELKQGVLRELGLETTDAGDNNPQDAWAEFAAGARDLGSLPSSINAVEMTESRIRNIRELTRDHVRSEVATALTLQAAEIGNEDRGGVVLTLPGSVEDMRWSEEAQKNKVPTLNESDASRATEAGLLGHWDEATYLAGNAQPFRISGRLLHYALEGNTLRIYLEPLADGKGSLAAISGSLLLLFSLGLLLSQAMPLTKALQLATRRRTALADDIRKRPPPGQSGG